jgi:group I intron endonuclease
MIGIYKITCINNNKVYIGSSSNINLRWQSHKSRLKNGKHNKNLLNSYNKYGIDSFIFEVLEECDVLDLIKREIYWADFYKNQGFVLFNCGEFIDNPTRGVPISEERKKKMSLSLMGKIPHNKNKKAPDWVKEKISQRQKEIGRKPTQENIEKLREIAKLPKSEQHKKNISESKKKSIGVKVICVQTGEHFNSLIDAGNKFNISYTAIRQSIIKNGKCRGHNFILDNQNN